MDKETKLDPVLKSVLSFATEKLDEVVTLARLALGTNFFFNKSLKKRDLIRCSYVIPAGSENDPALQENAAVWSTFQLHPALCRPDVRTRFASFTSADYARHSPFTVRKEAQHAKLKLPLFPTTTIGSLPQTAEVRSARLRLRKGELTPEAYKSFIGNFDLDSPATSASLSTTLVNTQ
jgi:5-methyltetrahydropteroyltriglutamate--homocysteine methyltransferase